MVTIRSYNGDVIDSIAYAELASSDWGYIYERHVAQQLTDEGFDVQMRGLEKGFRDGGIDLIARDYSREPIYIQCKYSIGKTLSKRNIEWVLFKASSYLTKHATEEKVRFWLVVPSMRESFSVKKSPQGRDLYPVAQYLLSKNDYQSKARLEIREIAMQR